MPIETAAQRDALINAIRLIRPDWDHAGIFQTMRKAHQEDGPIAHRSIADITIAAVRKASDPNTKFPVLLWRDGPHWPDPPEGARTGLSRPTTPCQAHPTQDAYRCHTCRADWLVDGEGDDPFNTPRHPPRQDEQ